MKRWAAAAASLVAACSASEPLDTLQPGESGRVVRVIDGDSLVLNTGLSVRLVGIEAPAGPSRDRAGAPYSQDATRLLEDMALGRRVQLFYPGVTRDRYDRALAHVRTVDGLGPELWLNAEMARQGAARARAYADTAALGELILAAEAEAREAQRGLWASPAYQIRAAADVAVDTRGFVVLVGVIGARERADDGRNSCALRFEAADIRVDVRRAAVQACRLTGRVRVRGYVSDGRLDLTHMLNVEPLAAPS
ncbi:MAG: thermonuclease family protein [Pseudomonadota bacterium]